MAAEVPEPAPARRSLRVLAAAVGILVGIAALVAAIAVPLAPVDAREVTVTWPKAGEAPSSTLAFFVPYQPREVQVDVPCSVVKAGQRLGRTATLVSSRLPGQPTEGFAVTTASGTAAVLVGGREALRAPIRGDCAASLHSDAAGSTASIGDRTVVLPGVRVQDIVAFATDLRPEQAEGMHVSAKAANPFESEPSSAKTALIGVQLGLVVLAFGVLALRTHRFRVEQLSVRVPDFPDARPAPEGRGLGLVDLVVWVVLGGWWLLGPNTPDDSFAATTVRNGLETGDIGNYYRWENASEAPFTLAQHLLEPFALLGTNPLAMRLPSVIAAVLTWLLLSRGVLSGVIPLHSRLFRVRALAALGFLVWWLPFGLGVRPEPFLALGIAASLACVAQAVHRQSLGLLGLGALAAGLSMAVNPMGITAVAPFVVLAPRIVRFVRIPDLALLAGIGSAGLVAMFADQSLAGAREATRMHGYYGPNVPWYMEIQRYEYLLGFSLQGDVARRTPVLLTLVVLVFSALLLSRGARWLPGMRTAGVPAACLALSLALMWLTPSKWTHYFGALAAVGAATLTAGVVLIAVSAKQWARERNVLLMGVLCTALALVAAPLAFAGKNNWFLHSHYGVPWGEEPVRPLNNPALWLFLAASLLGAAVLLGRLRRAPAARRTLILMPAVICVAAVAATAVIVPYSFVVAPFRQAGSYSVGGQNLASLTDNSCGIVDHVVVTPDAPGGAMKTSGSDPEKDGFRRDGGYPSSPPRTPAWGSAADGPVSTGSLTTGWFALPELPRNRELAVDVAGRSGDGNRIALEFAAGGEVVGERVLDDTGYDADEVPAYPQDHVIEDEPQDNESWRSVSVPVAEIPPGADQVRIRAVDATTDDGGWLGVTAPRVREVIPLKTYLRGRAPVLVDWSMTWSAPCLDRMPAVGGGLAEPPAVLVNPPNALGFGGTAAYERVIGGSFAGVREIGRRTEVPTRLLGVVDQPQYAEWGHLIEVDYPLPGNGFDVRSVPVSRWGWRGE
ncbi:arabinosyltransferase domain-containing protein [Saccharopolyspora taberi]|uniref:Arabinosyltransferase domain-containing protein n=1 Tax=Saccharopolyspora taberi TaxID=60895 RepID=A0ABN3VP10_9PSEU